jgi:hypothetical protein
LQHTFVVRFRTYAVSFRPGDYAKRNVKISVQQQPLKLLAVLLERPAEVVAEGNCAAGRAHVQANLLLRAGLCVGAPRRFL